MIDPAALDIARLALDFAERHNHSGVVVETGTLRALIEEYEPRRRPEDFPIPAHVKKDTAR